MTVVVPDPVPLEMPPGDPEAVEELVSDVAGAAFRLGILADELSGPAATAPGWLGDDATAAEAQVARVAGIVRESATAVLGATGRLRAHGELVRETRRAVSRLRAEQDEDFRAAWRRLGQVEDPRLAVMTGADAWVGVVAEVEEAEAARRRRHAALLEELADDAAATARRLAEAGRPVGGTGRPGDGGRVLAYLAAELPGWGRPEMSARGLALADALVRAPATPEERAALTAEAAAYAGDPAFATALIRGLGEVGVGQLLMLLGQEPAGPDDPMAGLLAAALGAAVVGEGRRDGVAAVLGATYVRADDRYGADATAAGMAAVLLAGFGPAGRGPRAATAGEWARQLLVREHEQKGPAGMAPAYSGRPREAADPAALAVEVLARGGDAGAASALLADQRVWEALLLRFWGDGGTALDDLIAVAGRDAGPAGDLAVRVGLETIGAGLEEGDPSDRTVDRANVEAVAPALAGAVAAHVTVVTDPLATAASGGGGERSTELLRGLGYLTVDRQAAAVVEAALTDWVAGQPVDLTGSSPAAPIAAVALPSAFVAVQEFGQRLDHALDGFELQEEAENKKRFWDWTVGLALDVTAEVARTPIGIAADLVNGYGPILLGMDGTFDVGPDRGRRYDADDAAHEAFAALPPGRADLAWAVKAQAVASFRRTVEVLDMPEPPKSPEVDLLEPLVDTATGALGGVVQDELLDRARRAGVIDFLPGRK